MTGYHQYKLCIQACHKCAAICRQCAASCAKDADVKMMTKCIQLAIECAIVCDATAALMSLGSNKVKDIYHLCTQFCDACAEECKKYENEHCRECAEACSQGADECEIM